MFSLGFVGDICFNQQSSISVETEVSNELSRADFIIGNLEALVESSEVNLKKRPRLCIQEESLEQLKFLNIGLVTLAHNHVYDNGVEGFLKTVIKLSSLNIPYIGAGLTEEEARRPYVKTDGTTKYKIFNYCHQDTNPSLPDSCPVFINTYSRKRILGDIKAEKDESSKIILIFHWGGAYEGGHYPSKYQYEDSQAFVDCGADLIIGHHSHTVQPYLLFNQSPVFFSLGNFIFSDVIFEAEMLKLSPRRKRGMFVMVSFGETMSTHTILHTRFTADNRLLKKNNLAYALRNRIFNNYGQKKLFSSVYGFSFKYFLPFNYFLFYKQGGISKFKNLNLDKIKRFLWKKY